MKLLKMVWVWVCALLGALLGALFTGMEFSSLPLTILGALVGLINGRLLGKYIPFYEWFT